MIPARLLLLLGDEFIEAASANVVIAGPYYVDAQDVFIAGATRQGIYLAGAVKQGSFVAGAVRQDVNQ